MLMRVVFRIDLVRVALGRLYRCAHRPLQRARAPFPRPSEWHTVPALTEPSQSNLSTCGLSLRIANRRLRAGESFLRIWSSSTLVRAVPSFGREAEQDSGKQRPKRTPADSGWGPACGSARPGRGHRLQLVPIRGRREDIEYVDDTFTLFRQASDTIGRQAKKIQDIPVIAEDFDTASRTTD